MLFGQTRRNLPSRFLDEFSDAHKDETLSQKTGRDRGGSTGYAMGYSGQNEYRAANDAALKGGGRKVTLDAKITIGKAPQKRRETGGAFAAGDRVEHRIFGKGTVLAARPLGGDTLVEVEFDTVGFKKAMANYAPMKKID
jgi:DNA helicase-2/ATP-dependent DNA helicase PcrA